MNLVTLKSKNPGRTYAEMEADAAFAGGLSYAEMDGNWDAIAAAIYPAALEQMIDFRREPVLEGRYIFATDSRDARVAVRGATAANFSGDGLTNAGGVYVQTTPKMIGALCFTLAAKFRTTQSAAGNDWWSQPTLAGVAIGYPSEGYDVGLMIGSGQMQAFSGVWNSSAAQTISSGVQVSDGEWHLAAVTWDGLVGCLYVDGVQRASYENSGSNVTDLSLPGYPLYLFRQNTTQFSGSLYGSEFIGTIQQFGMWSRALSADEVAGLGW